MGLQGLVGEWHAKFGFMITEGWVAKVISQILAALAYCHERHLIHKDLKQENIMLLSASDRNRNDPHAVLIDFGLSAMVRPGDLLLEGGCSPQTASPEMCAVVAYPGS